MRIIPAIDIIDGKCVRLTKGDYQTKKIYSENPLEMAKRFEDNGIEYLHLVDLDGAKSNRIIHYKILESICNNTRLKVDFGGGLKSDEDAKIAFESGAAQITGGSIAVNDVHTFVHWLEVYGSDKIILGADCIDNKIATNAWLVKSDLEVLDYIKSYVTKSLSYVVCTDIVKDGMLEGPSFELYKDILSHTDIRLIASGGVSSLHDLTQLKELGCDGAIIGKAIYEGNISLKELSELC